MMIKRLSVLLILFTTTLALAQEEKFTTVKSVRGEFSIMLDISDITGREAAERARENAKRIAIEQVCGSNMQVWDFVELSSAGEIFNSYSSNLIEGQIVEFSIIEEGHQQSKVRPAETTFYCIANVTVKKGIPADPDFVVDINGLKSVYFSGEILRFTILPHRDCYMKLFLFEDNNTGYILYPNSYDSAQVFSADTSIDFTNSPYYEFELKKTSARPKEINRLVFVFTKTERPFNVQVSSRSEIEKWITSIPNNQKYIKFAVLEIRDN